MTEVDLVARSGQPTESAGLTARPPLTLAEEHVLLLWQVTASAEKLLTATEHGRWPGAELAALAGYAQAEVLRQVSDEEALLFPAVPAQTVAGLARDHVRLRAAAELLARAAAGEQPMSPAQLAAAVRDFVVQLERHLRNEDDLLAAVDAVHAALSSGSGRAALTQAAVHGLGGVGKTSLARAYVARFEAEYGGVWWITATDRLAIQTGLLELARAGPGAA